MVVLLILLGVCVGPSLLWESSPNAPMRTLPTLIEMLINQCQTIFGPQVVALLGEVANDSGAEESDSLHCKYHRKSYKGEESVPTHVRNGYALLTVRIKEEKKSFLVAKVLRT